ncbi:MAG: permease-like cell division protein FtsX [Bdellovibrionales bacterium]|nr:permease-like cell division protein FtsX [Bdellovibrionales bacterium]
MSQGTLQKQGTSQRNESNALEVLRGSNQDFTNIDLPKVWETVEGAGEISPSERIFGIFKGAFRAFAAQPVGSAAVLVVLAVAITLWGSVLLTVSPLYSVLQDRMNQVPIRVLVDTSVDKSELQQVITQVQSVNGVRSVEVMSALDILNRVRSRLGADNPLLVGISEETNPFQQKMLVDTVEGMDRERVLTDLNRLIGDHESKFHLQITSRLSRSLLSLVAFVRGLGRVATFFSLAGAFLLVIVTLQLRFHLRREEIRIMELVGARAQYISAPLLVEGVLLGVLASGMALFGLLIVENGIQDLVSDSFHGFGFSPPDFHLGFWKRVLLVFAGVFLSTSGSWLAIRSLVDRESGQGSS